MIGSTGVAHREKHIMKLTCKYSVDVLYNASLEAIKEIDSYKLLIQDKTFAYIRIECKDSKNKRKMDILIYARYINVEYSELVLEVQLRDEVKENFRNLDMADIIIRNISEIAYQITNS